MSGGMSGSLSVQALFAERDARRKRDQEADEQLQRRKQEESRDFRRRLEEFTVTQERVEAVLHRIRRAFHQGETEIMLTAFPSDFCSDSGRAINNAGAPPINKPQGPKSDEPEWVATCPKGVREVYTYWHDNLREGGFRFDARIINFPDGKPGDVGLFFSWPKSLMDT